MTVTRFALLAWAIANVDIRPCTPNHFIHLQWLQIRNSFFVQAEFFDLLFHFRLLFNLLAASPQGDQLFFPEIFFSAASGLRSKK